MDADGLAAFYFRNPPDIRFITDINRRHFRLLLPNGRFFKVKDVIRSSKDLQEWLIKLRPSDVYYSTATYLDPTSVASRPKKSTDYWGPGNIILGHDVAFDLDRRPLSMFNLERARKDAVRLLDLLSDRNYHLKYAAFSGSKGFHLVFDDIDMTLDPDIRSRERVIIQRRKALVGEIVEKGIGIDTTVTADTRRIIRLPGTVNSKTGYCCQYLTVDQLRSPVVDWIDAINGLEDRATVPRFKFRPLPKLKIKRRPKAIVLEEECGYTTFITSSVLGTKGRHAVLLSLTKDPLDRVVCKLRQVQEDYGLTDIYLFELPRTYQAICLKTVQRNRYQKILDSTHSPSAGQLRNYDRVSLRMGPLVDREMKVLEPSAQFVTLLECPRDVRESNFVSQGHINFLRKHGLTPLEHSKTHGNGEFKLVDAEIRL